MKAFGPLRTGLAADPSSALKNSCTDRSAAAKIRPDEGCPHLCGPVNAPSQRLDWALGVCRGLKVRLTPIRHSVLGFLAAQRVPVSLRSITSAEDIGGRCDATTVYRTLMLFREVEVIRQVGLPDKASFFVLNVPGENYHFLICRICGAIHELPAGDHCESLEQEVAVAHGFAQLYHELQFFGICPECQKKPGRIICVKIPASGQKPRLHRNP